MKYTRKIDFYAFEIIYMRITPGRFSDYCDTMTVQERVNRPMLAQRETPPYDGETARQFDDEFARANINRNREPFSRESDPAEIAADLEQWPNLR